MERWSVYDAISRDGRHSGVLALRPGVVWTLPPGLFHRRKSRKSKEVYEWIFIHHANGEGENFDDSHTSREEIDKELAMGTFLLRGIEYRLERMDPLREKKFAEEKLL